MATDQRNLPAYFSGNTDFQTWVQGLEAQFSACNLTQTADTGQINSATVTLPAANASAGYHIYRFNDSQQTARPMYLKLEFGVSNTTDKPNLWLTMGSGSDGAGNLTGSVTSRKSLNTTTSKSAGITLPSYCSGDGSRISLVTNYDSASANFGLAFVIDRTRDANNNTTSDMVTVYQGATASGSWCQSIYSGGAITGSTSAPFGAMGISGSIPSGIGLTSLGGNVALWPAMVVAGQIRYLLSICNYNTADISASSTISVTNLGGTHTYITLPSHGGLPFGQMAPAYIWE